VLGEDKLALLTWRFERLHENWVNTRRTTRMCSQCSKPGHFVADCLEKTENKDGYKHWSSKDASTNRGAITSTRTSTRTSDGRGRRTVVAGRPERWSERATSTPAPPTLPRA
jgi:hypothetical protein